VIDLVKVGRKIKEVFGAIDNLSKFKKFSKLKASYIEYDKFADSDMRQGYFCYNCIYWVNTLGGQCMLVNNEGMDVMGKESSVIAPHGCCAGYEPNFDKIDDTRKGERRKKLNTTDVSDVTR
jgi:hypothetical protein